MVMFRRQQRHPFKCLPKGNGIEHCADSIGLREYAFILGKLTGDHARDEQGISSRKEQVAVILGDCDKHIARDSASEPLQQTQGSPGNQKALFSFQSVWLNLAPCQRQA